jgi:hypothetical protein
MKTVKGTLGYGFTVLMAAFLMVGCGKNSDNGAAAVVNPYNYYGSCAACTTSGIGTLATTITATDTLNETLQLQLFSNQASAYAYPQSYYGGQVAASGTITFPQAFTCGARVLAGTYQLQTYQQPGTWNGNQVSNLTLVGSGPTTLMIQLSNVFFTAPNRANINGSINNVNTIDCQLVMY